MAELAWKVKVNDLHLHYRSRVSQDACLVSIWCFSSKSMTRFCADKSNCLEFWIKMAKMNLEGRGQWPTFSTPAESIPWCMFGATMWILVQIYDELSHGQAKIPRILSENGQNDLKDQGQWPFFQYQPRVSHDACLIQIWWFQLKCVTSYQADKVKFTDRRTDDGRTDRRRQWQYPFGLKGQWVKIATSSNHSISV